MLPKLLDVPISTYLMVLAKMRRPSATPSARTSRLFSSRMTSAASFATSAPESTEMPTSAACSARASLTPSPRKPTPPPRCRCNADDARLVLGADPGEDRRRRDRVGERLVVECVDVCAGECLGVVQSEVLTDLEGDRRVVARDDLDGDAQCVKSRERRCGVRLRWIEEHQQPIEPQVVLVRRRGRARAGGLAAGHRDHAVSGGELLREGLGHGGRHRDASGEHVLGRAFRHEQQTAVRVAQEDGRHDPLMVERQQSEAGEAGQLRIGCSVWRCAPQSLVERVAADRSAAPLVDSVQSSARLVTSASPPATVGTARSKSIRPAVSVPVLSVKSTPTSPRSSMQTRRFTSTGAAACVSSRPRDCSTPPREAAAA